LTPFLLKRASIDIVLLKQNEIPFPSLECSKLGGGKSKDRGGKAKLLRERMIQELGMLFIVSK